MFATILCYAVANVVQLDSIAQEYGVPLIIDNAYGQPFPGAIYTQASLKWNANMILCMSLSKLGLPGLRTGIVIANHETIEAISRISGIMVLVVSKCTLTVFYGPGIS